MSTRMLRKRSAAPVVRRPHQDGFSLVELLVVLAIIGLVAGLIAPRVLNYLGTAKTDSARAQIHNIESAMELYLLDNGGYPTNAQGLAALSSAPTGALTWNGPYLKNASALKDPWGRNYVYIAPEGDRLMAVRSLGRDGKEGGDGEDIDLP